MLSALTRTARAARTGSSNNHPVDRRIQEVVFQPAGYTSVQRTDIIDVVEERSQVRFSHDRNGMFNRFGVGGGQELRSVLV